MALSYISLRKQLYGGIAFWLLRTQHSFGNVSAADEARQPLQCQFAAWNSHLGQALPESPQNAVVLACPRDQMPSSLCPLGTPCCLLKSVLSSQGAKIIQSFMWYLNPRQVFDLSQGGPKEA